VVVALSCAASVRGKRRKPNLLYLIADDHASNVLGSDGNRLAHTLSIDRLAAQGLHYPRRSHDCVAARSHRDIFTGYSGSPLR
jgi:arylsulfatase A-like enzyme